MSKKTREEAVAAINALLRSQNEILAYDINLPAENDCIATMNLEKEKFSVYIYSIEEDYTNPNGMRIEIDKKSLDELRIFRKKKGNKSAFIGWFKNTNKFVAWDPEHALSLNPSPNSGNTIYSGLNLKHHTTKLRPSIYKAQPQNLTRHAFVIGMHSSMLKFYLKNMETLHSMNTEEEIIFAMENGTTDIDNGFASSSDNLSKIPSLYRTLLNKRYPAFRKSILNAYDNACCVCGKKLGIVEAAHIIPFACDPNNNSVKNGLALCVEHHVLYDKALLMPGQNYKLVFNKIRAKELQGEGLDVGIHSVKKFDGKPIKLPIQEKDWPCKEGLLKGIMERDPRILSKP